VGEGPPSKPLVGAAKGVDADRRRHDEVVAGRESASTRSGKRGLVESVKWGQF
jgi:hypothetical protein